jgi:large conductance mechanosensitive channel
MLVELKKIREALEKPPAAAPPKGLWKEFIDFLSKYQVMAIAVAFIIGLYLGSLVKALVSDLLLPAIGLVVPGLSNLSTITYAVGKQTFSVGDFLSYLITFIIVAFVVFLIVKIVKHWHIM